MSEKCCLEDGKGHNISKKLSLAEWFVALLVAVLVVIISGTVFARYVLNIGIDWSDEVARLIFIWIVFVGAYIGFKRKSHASMNILYKFIPMKYQRYYVLLVGLLEGVFMLIITWFGVVQVLDTARFGQITAGLGVPMSWFYVVIPVTSFLIAIVILADAYRNFNNKKGDKIWVE